MTVHLEEEISLFIIKVFLESPHDSLLVSVCLSPSIEDGTPHRPFGMLPTKSHRRSDYGCHWIHWWWETRDSHCKKDAGVDHPW